MGNKFDSVSCIGIKISPIGDNRLNRLICFFVLFFFCCVETGLSSQAPEVSDVVWQGNEFFFKADTISPVEKGAQFLEEFAQGKKIDIKQTEQNKDNYPGRYHQRAEMIFPEGVDKTKPYPVLFLLPQSCGKGDIEKSLARDLARETGAIIVLLDPSVGLLRSPYSLISGHDNPAFQDKVNPLNGVMDLFTAAYYLAFKEETRVPYIDPTRLAVMGLSMGASSA